MTRPGSIAMRSGCGSTGRSTSAVVRRAVDRRAGVGHDDAEPRQHDRADDEQALPLHRHRQERRQDDADDAHALRDDVAPLAQVDVVGVAASCCGHQGDRLCRAVVPHERLPTGTHVRRPSVQQSAPLSGFPAARGSRLRRMTPDTPALQALRAAGLDHEVLAHGPVRSLVEAAEARGVEPADVVKTLVVRRGEDDHLLVLVPGLRTISWPRLRALLGVSRLSMPDAAAAKAATGYERGTITPFGATRAWPVVADERVARPPDHPRRRRARAGGRARRRRRAGCPVRHGRRHQRA